MLHFRKFTLKFKFIAPYQKHSMLLGNMFHSFNICSRYERFWTQQSPFQNYAYFCKNPYFATRGPITTKFYLKHRWGGGKAALGFGPDRIGTLVSMATDSSHRVMIRKILLAL